MQRTACHLLKRKAPVNRHNAGNPIALVISITFAHSFELERRDGPYKNVRSSYFFRSIADAALGPHAQIRTTSHAARVKHSVVLEGDCANARPRRQTSDATRARCSH